jgi:hypothetical protein
MTLVVAVADHGGRQARLAASLAAAFTAAGLSLEFRTHRELAAEASIEQPPGRPPVVTPDRPLLWLCPGDAPWPDTADGRFLAAESLAAARSVAQLTRSPVLNRPSAVAPCGTLPAGSARAVRWVRHLHPAAVRAERFSGRWPAGGQPADPLEVYDYATHGSSYGPPPVAAGPFRYRAAAGLAAVVKVRVVGDRAVCAADADPALLDASLRVAAGYQLDLAAVWWLVPADGTRRTLARIDCWEWDAAADATDAGAAAAADLSAALAAWMADRLRQPAEAGR